MMRETKIESKKEEVLTILSPLVIMGTGRPLPETVLQAPEPLYADFG